MKSLERIRFWLLVIWFAAMIIFVGFAMQAGTGFLIFTNINFWYFFVALTVLCVVAYYLLKRTMGKKE
jgi:hypothetical protein